MDNFKRIFSATAAIQAWARVKGEAPDNWEEAITDILADLRHLSHRLQVDFDHCNQVAEAHFETEHDQETNLPLFETDKENNQ